MVTITANGYRYAIRPLSGGWFVPPESAEYFQVVQLRPTDIVLDVGTHIGTFAIPASRRVRSVVAYEPNPSSYRLLVQNVAQNGRRNVQTVPAAVLGDRRSPSVGLRGWNTGVAIVSPVSGTSFVTVPAVPIDRAVVSSGANVIKIDVEDSELDIVRGCHVWPQVEQLVFEYHAFALHDTGDAQLHGLLSLLRQWFPDVKVYRHPTIVPTVLVSASKV